MQFLLRFRRGVQRWQPKIRTVEVQPPSFADEVGWVFMAAGVVVLGMIYTSAFERYGVGTTASVQALLPYQALFRDLPSDEQRMFRGMQEGMAEALRLRGTTGDWPTVAVLASIGAPPFARDSLDRIGYRWSFQRDGLLANYIGVPTRAGAALLILIQEPDPVTGERNSAMATVDEEHQILRDGTLEHITYWKRSIADFRPGVITDPAIDGWQQIRIKTPIEEMEERDEMSRR